MVRQAVVGMMSIATAMASPAPTASAEEAGIGRPAVFVPVSVACQTRANGPFTLTSRNYLLEQSSTTVYFSYGEITEVVITAAEQDGSGSQWLAHYDLKKGLAKNADGSWVRFAPGEAEVAKEYARRADDFRKRSCLSANPERQTTTRLLSDNMARLKVLYETCRARPDCRDRIR